MEIKLNLKLETLLKVVHFVENMELETAVLMMVGLLLTPLVIFSFWSLAMAVLFQLFWLGVKAGLLLFLVCAGYKAFLLMAAMNSGGPSSPSKRKCTLGDILLSVVFQTGLRIPPFIWDYFMVIGTTPAIPGKETAIEMDTGKEKSQKDMWAEFQQQLDHDLEDLVDIGPPPQAAPETGTGEDSRMEAEDDWNADIGGAGDCPYPKAQSDEELIREVILSSNLYLDSSNTEGGSAAAGCRRRARGGDGLVGQRKKRSRNKQ